MNVILCEDVDNLGDMGQTVKVATGYARNYLFPRRLAVPADSASAKQIEHELRIIRRKDEKRRAGLQGVASVLSNVTVQITVRAGENEKLYGSVTTLHIAEKLAELGHEIDKRLIKLAEPIKALGIYSVPVRLASGIEPEIKVHILPLEEPKAEAPEEPEDEDFDDDDDDE
jgi:large subunit ribosomal protein L9